VTAVSWLDRLGVGVLALCAALSAVLESLLVPLYAGSVIVPIAVVLALAGNNVFPRLARSLVPSTLGALTPFVAWLVVMVGFGVLGRPEGDVILPGSPTAAALMTYAALLGGAVVGTFTVVWLTPPPLTKEQVAPVSR
jgi:hypothetical protein